MSFVGMLSSCLYMQLTVAIVVCTPMPLNGGGTHTHKKQNILLVCTIEPFRSPPPPPPGEGGLWPCLVLGMCRPQGYVFHSFCLGKVLFSAQQSGKGPFFTASVREGPTVWQGVCFAPAWFDTKILPRVVILPPFSGKGGKFLSGKGKGMPPWAAQPYP